MAYSWTINKGIRHSFKRERKAAERKWIELLCRWFPNLSSRKPGLL